MKINVFASVTIILPIFFVSLVFSTTTHAKVLYGVSLGSNMDLPGGDYAQFYIHNAEECLKMCANEDKCAAYSFDRTSKNCRLKDSIPKSVPVRGMISGHKLSSKNNNKRKYVEPIPIPGNPAIEILPNTDLSGGDFRHTRVGNVKKCAQICKESTLCKAFTFDTAKEMCWLKDSISEKRYSTGHISGQKSIPDIEIMKQTDVPGGDYLQAYQENVRECANVCTKDEICDAFTYVKATKLCKLKTFQPKPIWKKGNISGIKR